MRTCEMTNKKESIAILAPYLTNDHPAGKQMKLVLLMLNEYYDFHLFSSEVDDDLKSIASFHKVYIPKVKPLFVRTIMIFFIYGALFIFKRLNKNYSLVHSLEGTSPFTNLVSFHFCGPKYSTINKSVKKPKSIRSIFKSLQHFIGGKLDSYIINNPYIYGNVCVSTGLKNDLIEFYNPKIEPIVIPNAIDNIKNSEHVKTTTKLNYENYTLIGMIAALGNWERKGLDILIKAIYRFNDKNSTKQDIKIIVVGDGGINKYRKIVKNLGLENQFVFAGYQESLDDFFVKSDFFILPSYYEAWPLVALEAANFKLPIISTAVNGMIDFVEEGVNGFFILNDVENIANVFIKLLSRKNKLPQMGMNAYKKVQQYDIKLISNEYNHLYKSIIEKKC